MRDFIGRHESLLKFILTLVIIVVLSLFLSCFIWSFIDDKYKNPESLEEEKFSCFNVLNSTEYQKGTLIVHLRILDNYKFKINNETLLIKEVYVIQDNETQKFYLEKYIYNKCNNDILIGDKECENYIIYTANVFVHKDVSEDIDAYYKKLRLDGKHVYMENYMININGAK